MIVIIAGGRRYQLTAQDWRDLDSLASTLHVTEVAQGGATGADTGARQWARSCGYPVTTFDADWQRYGRAAGPIRNAAMAAYADALIVFPGHDGTADMVRKAEAYRLPIYRLGQ